MWQEIYKSGATGTNGDYAGKSYWVCTYDWVNQDISYPVATTLYDVALTSGFSTSGVPTFAIIGLDNKVYFDTSTLHADDTFINDFTTALNLAIDEFGLEGVYVLKPIKDKYFQTDFSIQIDLNEVFKESHNNLMEFNLLNNTDPTVSDVEINGNIMTISGIGGKSAQTTIYVQAVSGESSDIDEFQIFLDDPSSFEYLEESFESISLPPSYWCIKYNTSSDGGLNGANLIDPPTNDTWKNNNLSTPDFGAPYVHSGENSIFIDYTALNYNWLISPYMQLDYNDYALKFWIWFSSSYYETKFHVLIDDGIKGWISLLSYDGSTPDNMYNEEISIPLSEYIDKTVRIAFVYEYCDGYELALDDIRIESPSGIEHEFIPSEIILEQNYPNPFNPSTEISFYLPDNKELKLSVFNTKGEEVLTVFEGKLNKGMHNFQISCSDMSAGIYFYKLQTTQNSLIKKMTLLK